MGLVPSYFVEKSWRNAIGGIEFGTLQCVTPTAEVTRIEGPDPGPKARFQIHSWDVLRRIMARGDIGLGEEYIAGSWDTDSVENLVSLLLLNIDHFSDFSHGNSLN